MTLINIKYNNLIINNNSNKNYNNQDLFKLIKMF